MYYIIHIATAFKSFRVQPREIQELIWARTLNDLRKKDPTHPLLSATLDQYLSKQAADPISLTVLLKKKMALTPEFGHIIGIGRALVMNGSTPKLTVAVARMIDDEKDLLQNFWQRLRAFTKDRGIPTFVTWNGLDFTFPFLIERSTALGVEPSCILPRARFQPWNHFDLFAELADYDPHRGAGALGASIAPARRTTYPEKAVKKTASATTETILNCGMSVLSFINVK